MRFAYIDSQGNEVSIPSVDALALRIELGAIGPDTQLYDAAADRWGPAHTHEIFLTLSREKDAEGFVAPPPPVASPPGGPDATKEETPGDEREEEVAEGVDAPEEEAPAEDAEPAPEEPIAEEEVSLDFTLTDADSLEEAATEDVMDLSPPPDPFGPPLADAGDAGAPEEPEAPETFDFGGVESFELEEEPETEDETEEPGHGMVLEEPLSGGEMDFSGVGLDDVGGGLDLETPMSDFTADAPPAWMEQDGPGRDEEEEAGMMDFSRPAAGAEEDEDSTAPAPGPAAGGPGGSDAGDRDRSRPPRPRPEPRSRPSPPRRKKKFPVGTVAGVIVIAALAVGGWYGWAAFQARRAAARAAAAKAVALPPVTIPQIPPTLVPRMRALATAALAGTIDQFRTEEASFGIPSEPRSAWLGGAYLSNASKYPDIQRYWTLIDSFVDHVRATDTKVFHDQFAKRLDSAGIRGDTAQMLQARADSGFLATRRARFEAYDEMDDLTNAALDLHQFLLDHEADITYAPAAGGVSEDPVLEAVPNTKALGNRMWSMVDRITGALNELGTLDKVTTERLSNALFDKLRAAGFK